MPHKHSTDKVSYLIKWSLCISEEFEDTKEAIRIRTSKKNRQHNGQEEKAQKGQEEFEDTKGTIRIRTSKKNRQHNGQKEKVQKGQEEFEDTKGAIRIRTSKKNRQHNGQEEKVHKDKQRSTKHTHKTEDRVTRTPLKTGGEREYI